MRLFSVLPIKFYCVERQKILLFFIMRTETLKKMFDACYQAKRARDLLPPLPDGVTSSDIHYLDAIGSTSELRRWPPRHVVWVMTQGLIQTLLIRLPFAYIMSIQPNASLTMIGLAAPVSTMVGIILNVGFFTWISNRRHLPRS